MAIGATFGALNIMYSSINGRTREIATLRALGFGRLPIAVSVLTEAFVLSLVGAVVGILIAYLFFDGTTFTSGALTQTATQLSVTPGVATAGLFWGITIGLIGGLFPAIAAMRRSITEGLRVDG